MKVISIFNMKGGVGKTTTSDNVAVGLANKGYKVLLVDFDPQANTTQLFLKDKKHDIIPFLKDKLEIENYTLNEFVRDFNNEIHFNEDVSDCLFDKDKVYTTIKRTNYQNLDILPAKITLSLAETNIMNERMKAQHDRLDKVLKAISDHYDYAIIDCAPSLNLLTLNAMVASHQCIIPMKVDFASVSGFIVTLENVYEAIQSYNLDLDISILFTMVEKTITDKLFVDLIKKTCKNHTFNTIIRNGANQIKKMGFNNQVILDAKLDTHVKNDYINLVNEIVEVKE